MLDGLPPEQKAGGIAGLALLGFTILRWIGLRVSKDAVTLKADASDRDAFTRLQKRVEDLDERLADVEAARNHIFGFVTKCMAYISRCECAAASAAFDAELKTERGKP
jgi:hypothetical protein